MRNAEALRTGSGGNWLMARAEVCPDPCGVGTGRCDRSALREGACCLSCGLEGAGRKPLPSVPPLVSPSPLA